MAFTETQTYRIEVLDNFYINVRRSDIILKDGKEVGKTYHRVSYQPGADVSSEVDEVQAVASAVWTEDVIRAFNDSLPPIKLDEDDEED